jgi:uncharacterized SAM-binding protein YcdF (DUF218 family)
MIALLLNLISLHFLLLASGALLLYFYIQKRKIRRVFYIAYGLILAIASTHLFPAMLMAGYEAKQPQHLPGDESAALYIHVFGAGYNLDEGIAPTKQLDLSTLGRLVEGVRLMKLYPNAYLVTSGRSNYGYKSQAEVVRDAAIALGVEENRIIALTTPHNTYTEIEAFTQKIGKNAGVIAVSDAAHLPRIALLYSQYPEMEAYYSPVNYRVKLGENNYNGLRFPSMQSINLLNDYWIAQLKYCKDYLRVKF